jgi:hypothetical protein
MTTPGRRTRFLPHQQRERYRVLEKQASELLKADRRRRQSSSPAKSAPITSGTPQRLTLADLPTLRKQGRVP